MNLWNRQVLVLTLLIVVCAAGGTYLAHDRNIAFVALVFNTFILAVVLIGSDRIDGDGR